ncbi:MAG: EamA/RhaT family transporter, partial [Albidovulum sp.]
AMRMADASALMPFRYSRLIFSLIIGLVVFSERPDAMTLWGASLILTAAFYTYLRERRIALSLRAESA